jgi:hypothetical protein
MLLLRTKLSQIFTAMPSVYLVKLTQTPCESHSILRSLHPTLFQYYLRLNKSMSVVAMNLQRIGSIHVQCFLGTLSSLSELQLSLAKGSECRKDLEPSIFAHNPQLK